MRVYLENSLANQTFKLGLFDIRALILAFAPKTVHFFKPASAYPCLEAISSPHKRHWCRLLKLLGCFMPFALFLILWSGGFACAAFAKSDQAGQAVAELLPLVITFFICSPIVGNIASKFERPKFLFHILHIFFFLIGFNIFFNLKY